MYANLHFKEQGGLSNHKEIVNIVFSATSDFLKKENGSKFEYTVYVNYC